MSIRVNLRRIFCFCPKECRSCIGGQNKMMFITKGVNRYINSLYYGKNIFRISRPIATTRMVNSIPVHHLWNFGTYRSGGSCTTSFSTRTSTTVSRSTRVRHLSRHSTRVRYTVSPRCTSRTNTLSRSTTVSWCEL